MAWPSCGWNSEFLHLEEYRQRLTREGMSPDDAASHFLPLPAEGDGHAGPIRFVLRGKKHCRGDTVTGKLIAGLVGYDAATLSSVPGDAQLDALTVHGLISPNILWSG